MGGGMADRLSSGEYNYETNADISAIKEVATSAMNATGRQGAVFVKEYAGVI
jgi:hypothetical protein